MVMETNPLARPDSGSEALGLFLEHFRLDRRGPRDDLLGRVSAAFSRIPYENLTKLIKLDLEGSAGRARRLAREVVADHVSSGAGGTCFSLTATLLHILRALGFEAEPILADRSYGANTHCALAVFLNGRAHLIDPGFLITRPIPLDDDTVRKIDTSFNRVLLLPKEGGKIDLYTVQKGNRTYRLTFKPSPADPGEFLKAWDDSFGWDMMRYPLLTRVAGSRHIYLQGRRFQVRSLEDLSRSEIDLEDLPASIHREFGVDPSIARKAIEILRKKGEILGGATAP